MCVHIHLWICICTMHVCKLEEKTLKTTRLDLLKNLSFADISPLRDWLCNDQSRAAALVTHLD